MPAPDRFQCLRHKMVEEQVVARGISDGRVVEAMRRMPRELFLPAEVSGRAYEDRALAVGMGQTLSQPFIVALMTQELRVGPADAVLEVGTGTGYQTAILAQLAREVFTIERIPELAAAAQSRLNSLGIDNVTYRTGDGSGGWPDGGLFDRIMVTAAAPTIARPLREQLADEGRLVIPTGTEPRQRLSLVERHGGEFIEKPGIAVRFVLLIGKHAHAG